MWKFLGLFVCAQAQGMGDYRCPCAQSSTLLPPAPGLPPTWGVGCAQHELNAIASGVAQGVLPDVDECRSNASAVPGWCNASWCFITYDNCTLGDREQGVGRNNSFTSYGTCGWYDTHAEAQAAGAQVGRPIRVVFLEQGTLPFTRCDTGNATYPCRGIMADYAYKAILPLTGGIMVGPAGIGSSPLVVPNKADPSKYFPPEVIWAMSNNSDGRTRLGNTFWTCIYAAGMGFVDVCISNLGVTDVRLLITSMVVASPDIYNLFVKAVPEDTTSWAEKVRGAFAPFTLGTWLVLIAIFGTIGGVLCWQDREAVLGDKPFKSIQNEAKITLGAMAVLLAALAPAYSAGLAAVQVSNALQDTTLSGFDDVVTRGLTVCVGSPLTRDQLISNYPLLNVNKTVVVTNTFQAANNGQCNVVVESSQAYRYARVPGGDTTSCNWQTVGQSVVRSAIGVATSRAVAKTIRFYQNQLEIKNAFKPYEASYMPTDTCPTPPTPPPFKIANVSQFTGPLLIIMVILVIAIGVQILLVWKRPPPSQEAEPQEVELRSTATASTDPVSAPVSPLLVTK